MTTISSNLRKAAVLLRSLDSDTAAIMLAQLSPEEAASIRSAIRALGPLDPEEQSDVAAEFRRTRPTVIEQASGGVELAFSAPLNSSEFSVTSSSDPVNPTAKRFEFLANAPTSALVPYLAREHAQTIAVVLAHLAPARAASVLAELPDKLQAATIERLSALGETDPESVTVLERELATWFNTRTENRGVVARRRETMANILAAADVKTRDGILSKLKMHNNVLAEQFAPKEQGRATPQDKPSHAQQRLDSEQSGELSRIKRRIDALSQPHVPSSRQPAASFRPLPRIQFDQLIHLDPRTLTAVLRDVDANVLALALVGSHDDLIDRICQPMPKRTARTFRRQLRRLGPTRLSDVETAQRAVADTAARHLAQRQRELTTAAC